MARPEIKGLKYFPFDTGFFRDKKIRLLRGEHGSDGVEIYQRLLCKCYEDNGYYMVWDDDEDFALLADETGYPEDKVRLIVSTCLRRSLFDDTLFKVGNVLTSRSIQRRYFSAIRDTKAKAAAQGRHTFIDEGLCLLREEDFSELNKPQAWLKLAQNQGFSGNNRDKSGINNSKSGINPLNEMKGNNTLMLQPADGGSNEEEGLSDGKRKAPSFDHSHNAYLAAEYMAKKILKHTPNFPHLKPEKREKTLQGWAKDIDKLLRIDGVDFGEFKKVLQYSQADSFWQTNILSGRKLREKYSALLVKMNGEERKHDGRP